VRVQSENPRSGEIKHTNSAYITMVAVDEHGRPVGEAPPLRTETADEQRREREAQVRRANRLAERDQLRDERSDDGPLIAS
jgi:acyl-CoA hydrolase